MHAVLEFVRTLLIRPRKGSKAAGEKRCRKRRARRIRPGLFSTGTLPSVMTLVLLVGIALAGTAACKRRSKEYGGMPQKASVQWSVAAGYSAVPQLAVIREVLPLDTALDGQALYLKHCSACHQATGLGVPAVFPPLSESPYVTGDNTERLASIMLYGLVGPIKVKGMTYVGAMTPFGPLLKDDELAAIATYIRSAWGNRAATVSAEVFARMRQKWGARGPFQIAELGEEQ